MLSTTFDDGSLAHLHNIHPVLRPLLVAAREEFDYIITDSTRPKKEQEQAFNTGHSEKHFGESPHNYLPCPCADIAPAPYRLYRDNIPLYIELQIKIIKPLALKMGIPIRQGLDWNRNGILTDEKFRDYPHIELYPWRKFAGALFHG